jgi:glycerol-3-phosphate dehydrogenase (NAD(P)+)
MKLISIWTINLFFTYFLIAAVSESDVFRDKIIVIGGGAYGTALALNWHNSGKNVSLLVRSQAIKEQMQIANENKVHLPSIPLGDLDIIDDPYSCKTSSCIVMAIPSQCYALYLQSFVDYIQENTPIVIASKGLDNSSGTFLSDLFIKRIKNPILVFSGPQFAKQLAMSTPSCVALAHSDEVILHNVASILGCRKMTIFQTPDMLGVQLLGAIKNIFAVGCGILRGKECDENTIAKFVTLGIKEVEFLNCSLGGKQETFLGPAGFGDIFLTCSSLKSRNNLFGLRIGKNETLTDLVKENVLSEGYYATSSIYRLMCQHNIEIPLIKCMYEILFNNQNTNSLIELLCIA